MVLNTAKKLVGKVVLIRKTSEPVPLKALSQARPTSSQSTRRSQRGSGTSPRAESGEVVLRAVQTRLLPITVLMVRRRK